MAQNQLFKAALFRRDRAEKISVSNPLLLQRAKGNCGDETTDGEHSDDASSLESNIRHHADINSLPPEMILSILAYLNPMDLFSLKLAGSRYIADIVRTLPRPTLSKYIEKIRTNGDERPDMLIAAEMGHEPLLRALLERALRSDAVIGFHKRSSRYWWRFGYRKLVRQRERVALCQGELSFGISAIHQAAAGGHDKIVVFLLSKGLYVEQADKENKTPLHYAARGGHNHTIKFLCENGANVSTQDIHRCTALHEAAKSGHELTVKLLLEQGAWPDARCRSYHGLYGTPLHIAASNGYRAIVQLLLDNNADINLKGGRPVRTPLHHAVISGHDEVVKLLLDRGADVEFHLSEGPLSTAADAGHDAIVKLLLGRDTPEPIPEAAIFRAIFCAMSNRHKTTLQLLLAKRPCTEWKDGPYQRTILHHAACRGLALGSMVSILLEHGADLEARDSEGNTPLLCAARYGTTEIAKLLLSKGADIGAKSCENKTAIHYAKAKGNRELTRTLFEYGAPIPSTDPGANFPVPSLQEWHRSRKQGRTCFFLSGSI